MRGAWLAGALVAAAASCEPSPPAPPAAPAWPAGTALAVDDTPILAAQVDFDSVWVERIEPAAAPAQLRRLALANISLPRVLARLMAPEKCAAARQAADEALAQLRAGTFAGAPKDDGSFGEPASGGWSDLGLVTWGAAMDLALGEWSEVLEEPGRFVIVRRLATLAGPVPMATRVEIDWLVFPWLDASTAAQAIEREHDAHVLTIVDPAWRTIVPELTQSRMRPKNVREKSP